MNRISPERFVGDPAFTYGSQDFFSVFSPIYCFFIKIFPIDVAAFVLGILIHGLFALSLSRVMWKWAERFHCLWLALPITLFFFALYAYGEPRNEFVFNIKTIEPFPVPRTLSAALGLFGLSVIFERKWMSLCFFVIGMLIHPLTAGWAIPLWAFFYYPKTRIPVAVFSLLFPLTVFVGKGPLMVSQEDWVKISLGDGFVNQVLRMCTFLCFFLVAYFKMNMPMMFKKMTLSIAFVLGIALYWLVASLSVHHVFLYQVQTFRIQWMCQVLAVFLSALFVSRVCVFNMRKEIPINFWNKVMLATVLILWVDCTYFVALLILVSLCQLAIRHGNFKIVKAGVLLLCFGCVCFSCYWTLGISPCSKPDYVYAARLLFAGPLFALSAAFILCITEYVPKLRQIGMVLLLVECGAIMHAWNVLPKESFSIAFVLGTLICILFQEPRSFQKICLPLLIIAMISCTFLFYDSRSEQQRTREWSMNQFVQSPPFPYIPNRGRILFSVRDYGEEIPRLRFLSGGYYDFQVGGGGMLFQKQKKEVDNREWNIYSEDRRENEFWMNLNDMERFSKVQEILFDRDSLLKRMRWLCSSGEILHLISDMKLPWMVKDSLTLWFKGERIWLYPCN